MPISMAPHVLFCTLVRINPVKLLPERSKIVMIVIELTNELIVKSGPYHPLSAWFMNSKSATIIAGSTSKKHTIPIVIAIGFWDDLMGTCGFDGGWVT